MCKDERTVTSVHYTSPQCKAIRKLSFALFTNKLNIQITFSGPRFSSQIGISPQLKKDRFPLTINSKMHWHNYHEMDVHCCNCQTSIWKITYVHFFEKMNILKLQVLTIYFKKHSAISQQIGAEEKMKVYSLICSHSHICYYSITEGHILWQPNILNLNCSIYPYWDIMNTLQ